MITDSLLKKIYINLFLIIYKFQTDPLYSFFLHL